MDRIHNLPPISPYSDFHTSKDTPLNPTKQVPLTLPESDRERLRPYLHPGRTKFLVEGIRDRNYASGTDRIPHVTLTYAQSLDSQISLNHGQPTTLSGPETKAMTHWLRANHDAILVGAGTANADNPGLNTRFSSNGNDIVEFAYQPRPFILDPSGKWEEDKCGKLFENAIFGIGRAPWFITSDNCPVQAAALESKVSKIRKAGGDYISAGIYQGSKDGVDWEAILKTMWSTGIRSVMIEGGATVINDLLRKRNQHLISSIIVTIAPTYLGAGGVVVAPPRSEAQNEAVLKKVTWVPFGQDVVMAGILKEDFDQHAT